jgi:hypothetical protein
VLFVLLDYLGGGGQNYTFISQKMVRGGTFPLAPSTITSLDATSIEKVIYLIADPELELNLVYIESNFGSLSYSITRLELSKIWFSYAILEEKNKI